MNKDRFEPDAATLISDDELLDALGRGERPAKDDPLALAFALWREDIDGPAVAATAPAPQRARKLKPGNKFRWGIISGIVAALLGGGLTVAVASTAEPESPLWSITEKVFPKRAESVSVSRAELALVEARTAISEERLDLADRKVKEAESLIGKVVSLVDQEALRAELAVVRELLDAARARLGTVTPVPTGVPGLPIPVPAPSGGLPLPTPTAPVSPDVSPSKPGGILPPLPSLLPSLPLPTIKLPL